MLKHRDGTEYEDLTYISSKPNSDGIYQSFTNRRLRQKNSVFANDVMKDFIASSEKDTVIALHNHPNGTVPSLDDLKSARKYKYGLIIGHNGKIFKYSVASDISNQTLKKADIELEFLNRYLYDTSKDHKDHIAAKIEQLRELGVGFEVIR